MNPITYGILNGLISLTIAIGIWFAIKRYTRSIPILTFTIFVTIGIGCFLVSLVSLAPFVIGFLMGWLLVNQNAMWLAIIFVIVMFVHAYWSTTHEHKEASTIHYILYSIAGILTIVLFIIHSQETNVYESEQPWKTIYTNNIEADVSLSLQVCDSCLLASVDTHKTLGDSYGILQRNRYGDLKLTKGDISESRHIYFDSDNLNGTLNEHSKITKIEYRPIVRMYHTLFGFKVPYEKPNVDGEIRITVSEDERHTELRQLFDD